MTDFNLMASACIALGNIALVSIAYGIAQHRSAKRWRVVAKEAAQANRDSHLLTQYWAEEHDLRLAELQHLRKRLFRAGGMTKAEASAHASEMGKRGRAKQLATKAVA